MKALFLLAAFPLLAASPLSDAEIARRAEALKPKLIETRRHLHMYPELSNREKETGKYIAERMRQLGYENVQTNVALHGVAMELVPAAGGDALSIAGAKQSGAWAPGTYRFLVARRLASGLQAPAGEYRLRVRAEGPDGTGLASTSAPFTLR